MFLVFLEFLNTVGMLEILDFFVFLVFWVFWVVFWFLVTPGMGTTPPGPENTPNIYSEEGYEGKRTGVFELPLEISPACGPSVCQYAVRNQAT